MNNKVLLFFLLMILNFSAGFSQAVKLQGPGENADYVLAGTEFSTEQFLSAQQMQKKYEAIKPGDTLNITFKARVNSVCQNKGCWMKIGLANGEEVMVKFKDYAFFVPKDIKDETVIVHGKAFVSEVSVEEQRHYAEDAGKSLEEIQKITSPEKTLSFEAEGVKILK